MRRAVLALAVLAAGCAPPDPMPDAPLRMGAWEGPSLSGPGQMRLDPADGAMVVNVWATWCEPCRREMASLGRAQRAVAPQGVRVVGVNVDGDARLAREYVRRLGIVFPSASDPGSAHARGVLGVAQLPTTLGVARDGRILWREVGARDWSEAGRLARLERLAQAVP